MLKISKMADYAVVVVGCLARQDARQSSAANVSVLTGLPVPTASKILKQLAKAGIVMSQRGAGGGYFLSRSAEDISVSDVITAMDGPVLMTSCVGGQVPDCNLTHVCAVRGRWDGVNTAIRQTLEQFKIVDILAPHTKGRVEHKEDLHGRH